MTGERFTYRHFDWLQWHIYNNGEYLVECSGNEEEDIKPLVDLLNTFDEENIRLKNKLCIKEDLIQQLKNELNTDCYKRGEKYRKKFINVCEDLADANKQIEELKSENNMLKHTIGRNESYIQKVTTKGRWSNG